MRKKTARKITSSVKTESINRVKHNLEFQKTMIGIHNGKHRKHIKPAVEDEK